MTKEIHIFVFKGKVLGVNVYRGYARLCDIARISKADIYDQKTNPSGTQRDLSPKHAREAYDYVKNREMAFWPEVFLCVRDDKAISFLPHSKNDQYGNLCIDTKKTSLKDHIAISRVDGNHRLHFATGEWDGYPAIEREVSFCLAYGLTLEQEITLFRDINDNQRRMNTSHLDNIEIRLTPEEKLKKNQPALFIAQQLGRDKESPMYNRIFEGGKKEDRTAIPLRTLHLGITYMFSKPSKLTALRDADAQYKVIRNFFNSVKLWVPNAWGEPSRHLLLRGAGLWGICFIGADVLDRALSKGQFSVEEILGILTSGREWDWSNSGDFRGLSGRGGAIKISEMVASEFAESSGVSVKDLFRKIMKS